MTAPKLPVEPTPRFLTVICSNCGQEFGPADHGFSHCQDHAHLKPPQRAIQIGCDCDPRSDKCALGRVRTLATTDYSRCCISLPSAFDEAWYHAPGEMKKYIDALRSQLTSALARVADMEGEVGRLKEVERDLSQMVNAKSNLLCNIGDTLRSRGINPTFHMDERVIELAHMMEAANARAEAMAVLCGELKLHLEEAHSGFISGCGSDMAWEARRDQLVVDATAALDATVKS